ncbi:MAG TPA: hypothetical protein VIL65_02310 [Beijerinckiaceae bacterium]|jgi:hypothetical protein
MRHITIADGLRLRFPNRSEQFDQGVEIGALAVLMDLGTREFDRWIAQGNLEQARSLAEKLGYRVVEGPVDDGFVHVTLRTGAARPALRLVHTG